MPRFTTRTIELASILALALLLVLSGPVSETYAQAESFRFLDRGMLVVELDQEPVLVPVALSNATALAIHGLEFGLFLTETDEGSPARFTGVDLVASVTEVPANKVQQIDLIFTLTTEARPGTRVWGHLVVNGTAADGTPVGPASRPIEIRYRERDTPLVTRIALWAAVLALIVAALAWWIWTYSREGKGQ